MFHSHKHILFWLAYATVLVIFLTGCVVFGIFQNIWLYDITLLSSLILCAWLITEIVGAYQLWQINRSIDKRCYGTASDDQMLQKHSFVAFMGEIIVTVGIFGTVIGVIIALIPFFGMKSFDPTSLQPQLLKMFAGIAVAFFPTAISILIKVFLDFHARLHQNAVLEFLHNRTKIK